MAIIPTKTKKEFKVVPAGNHVARLYSVMHLGIIPGEYMGEPKETDTVRIGFELPNEKDVFKEGEEPKPYVISQEYTLSMNEKANLRKFVEGMLGVKMVEAEAEDFDVTSLIGTTCMLNVVHKIAKTSGNEYALIQNAAPMPRGIEVPAAVNAPYLLDFSDNWSDEKFEKLPQFLRDKIASSINYKELKGMVVTDPLEHEFTKGMPQP